MSIEDIIQSIKQKNHELQNEDPASARASELSAVLSEEFKSVVEDFKKMSDAEKRLHIDNFTTVQMELESFLERIDLMRNQIEGKVHGSRKSKSAHKAYFMAQN